MKIISIIVLGLFLVLGIVGLRQLRVQPTAATDSGNLILTNLPSQYCPTRSRVLITQASVPTPVLDREIAVDNCRYIALSKYLSGRASATTVHIKLARALAFKFEVTTPLREVVEYPVQLGDVTGDNIIDNTDEKTVTDLLFATNVTKYDLTGDKALTIDDLSIIRLNQGVGVARPDGVAWAKVSDE